MNKDIEEIFDLAEAQAKYRQNDIVVDDKNGVYYFKYTNTIDIAFDDRQNKHSVYVRNSICVFKRTWKEDADFISLKDLFEKEEDFIQSSIKKLA